MRTLSIVWKIIDFLRRPFIQRLIALIVSMLLAMSLSYATLTLTFPQSRCEVASSLLSSLTNGVRVEVTNGRGLMFLPHGRGPMDVLGVMQQTEDQATERRYV